MSWSLSLTVQYAIKPSCVPNRYDFRRWVKAALILSEAEKRDLTAEITLRIVGIDEGYFLNQTYRQKAYATNVLTFGFESEDLLLPLSPALSGDIVLCAPVIEREAQEQNKTIEAHYAHLVVHGMLHLQGYDHVIARDAEEMEALEIDILQRQGFANPYRSL